MLGTNELFLNGLTADPTVLVDGMIWYRSDLKKFFKRLDGKTQEISTIPQSVDIGLTALVFSGVGIWSFVGNELVWQTPDGSMSDAFWSFTVPKNYVAGATLDIWVQKVDGATGDMTAWINNVVDTTIDVLDISPASPGAWVKKTLTFGSAIVPGDIINLQMNNTTTGPGTRVFRTKSITFNY